MNSIEIVGFLGAIGLLFAYWQLNRGVWDSRTMGYQLINLAAGLLLTGYSLYKEAYATAFLNGVFCLIAVFGIQKIRRGIPRRISK